MNTAAKFALSFLGLCILFLSGCGASNGNCVITASVSPATATADHAQVAPGNQVQFSASIKSSPSCAIADTLIRPDWNTSDPTNTSIDANTGLATCLHATGTPATINYTRNPVSSFTPASLTCK